MMQQKPRHSDKHPTLLCTQLIKLMRIERFVDTPHTTDVTLICHNGGLQQLKFSLPH